MENAEELKELKTRLLAVIAGYKKFNAGNAKNEAVVVVFEKAEEKEPDDTDPCDIVAKYNKADMRAGQVLKVKCYDLEQNFEAFRQCISSSWGITIQPSSNGAVSFLAGNGLYVPQHVNGHYILVIHGDLIRIPDKDLWNLCADLQELETRFEYIKKEIEPRLKAYVANKDDQEYMQKTKIFSLRYNTAFENGLDKYQIVIGCPQTSDDAMAKKMYEKTKLFHDITSPPMLAQIAWTVEGLNKSKDDSIVNDAPNDFSATIHSQPELMDKDKNQASYQDDSSVPLFAKGENDKNVIDPNDINQGNIGDCYLMATLSSFAKSKKGWEKYRK